MMILKNPEQLHMAKQIFNKRKIKFTCEGKKPLGAALEKERALKLYI